VKQINFCIYGLAGVRVQYHFQVECLDFLILIDQLIDCWIIVNILGL